MFRLGCVGLGSVAGGQQREDQLYKSRKWVFPGWACPFDCLDLSVTGASFLVCVLWPIALDQSHGAWERPAQ